MAGKVISIEDRIPKLKEQRKKRVNRTIIFLILLFFLLVIIVLYFQSPLSRVGKINISGNLMLTNEEILEIAEIDENTIIWNIDTDKVKNNMLKLPEVKAATASISLPNHINLNITEYKTIGYQAEKGNFYPLIENGKIKKIPNKELDAGPILIDFQKDELLQLAAKQLINIPIEIRNSISEIIYSPSKTDNYRIIVFMNDGYEVHATLRTFSERIKYYPTIVKQLGDKKGIIDLEVALFFKTYQSIAEQTDEESDNQVENEG